MKRKLLAAGFAWGLAALPASADETTMTAPIQAGSLHEGLLDMVAFWTSLEDEGYELIATFRARDQAARPMRVVLKLMEGDSVAFGLPGHAGSLYRFSRRDGVVKASVEQREAGAAF